MTLTTEPAVDSGHSSKQAAGTPTTSQSHGGHAGAAARSVHRRQSVQVPLPMIGPVRIPGKTQLVYMAGIGGLALGGIVEWPVAALLGLGHVLASQSQNKALEQFGDALDDA